jgi:hypothetical protein
MIPEDMKKYAVCRVAIEKDPSLIKYVTNQTENLCNVGLLMGHKNLHDI